MSRNIWISYESSRKFQNLLTIWEPCAITVITARRVASLHQSLWTCKHQSVRTSAGCSVLRLRGETSTRFISSRARASSPTAARPSPVPLRFSMIWKHICNKNLWNLPQADKWHRHRRSLLPSQTVFFPTLLERLQMRALKDVSLCYSPASTPLCSNCKVCHWCESYHTRTSPHQTPPLCAVRGSRAAKFFQFY